MPEVGHMGNKRIWCSRCSEWYMHPYKNYRDSLDDAMEVIEKLFREGYIVSLHANGVDGFYWANVCTPKPECKWFESPQLQSPAEAICLAALNSVSRVAP